MIAMTTVAVVTATLLTATADVVTPATTALVEGVEAGVEGGTTARISDAPLEVTRLKMLSSLV
jgi:hypothetical protein